MNRWWQLALFSWEWRPEVLIPLATAALLYSRGWLTLRRLGGGRLASRLRLVSYLGGVAVLAIALLSFIDPLGGQLFIMHMVQHLLLTMFAPVLIWAADPFPFVVWGLPRRLRPVIVLCLQRTSRCRRAVTALTRPGLAWLIFIGFFVGWHDPNLYNLALRRSWVHDLQHLTFAASALLFWWHVFPAGPHLHRTSPVFLRVAYLLTAIPPTMITGVTIALAASPIYTYYTSVPRIWGLTVMQDQALGGAIMWIPTNMMYILAALLVLAHGLDREGKQRLASPAG